MVSLPSPPLIVSSKSEPVIVSFPPLPLIVLPGSVPPQSMVSLPALPVTVVSVCVTPGPTTHGVAACAEAAPISPMARRTEPVRTPPRSR